MSLISNNVRMFMRKLLGLGLRLSVLGVLLFVVFQQLVTPLLMPVATNAVISARRIRVQSPINGVVTGPPPVFGSVQAGHVLVSVEDSLAEDQRLRELQLQFTESAVLVSHLRGEVRASSARAAEWHRDFEQYQSHIFRALLAEQKLAELKLAISQLASHGSLVFRGGFNFGFTGIRGFG